MQGMEIILVERRGQRVMPRRFFDSPMLHQLPGRFAVDLPAVGVELQASANFSLRSVEIALLGEVAGTHAVSRGERWIELQRFFGRRQPVVDVPAVMVAQARLSDCKQRPCLGIVGIELDRALRCPNDDLVAPNVAIIA